MRILVNKKQCAKCNQEKDLELFHRASRNKDGRNSYCKECMQEYTILNKKSIKKSKNKYNEKRRLEVKENQRIKKEKALLEAPIKKELARQKRIEHQRIYRLNNLEKKKLIDKEYRERTRSQRNRKDKERKSKDPQYRISVNLRVRLNKAIENNQKIGSAIDDLGCSVDFLKSYLESLFQPGMTWDNYGKGVGTWQIDHIEALCLFDLTNRDQFLKANHYSNLQPIWYWDHLEKTQQDVTKSKVA